MSKRKIFKNHKDLLSSLLLLGFFVLLSFWVSAKPYDHPNLSKLEPHLETITYDQGVCKSRGGFPLEPELNYEGYATTDAFGLTDAGYKVCSPYALKVGSAQIIYAAPGSSVGYVAERTDFSDMYNVAFLIIYLTLFIFIWIYAVFISPRLNPRFKKKISDRFLRGFIQR